MNNIFILDFGSGNTCRNDSIIVNRMIDSLHEIIRGREDRDRFVIKWQLFKEAGDNIPLSLGIFHYAYRYAKSLGILTTSSVFDETSAKFLGTYEIPFVKFSNRPDVRRLANLFPRTVPLLFSYKDKDDFNSIVPEYIYTSKWDETSIATLPCVSEYPAKIEDYENRFHPNNLGYGISDHTIDWDLYRKYLPGVYECHYKLEDSTGIDAGEFARTPKQLTELLESEK